MCYRVLEDVLECSKPLLRNSFNVYKILELSGIGSKALLEKHGIEVLIDNPNVGENIQDHAIVC